MERKNFVSWLALCGMALVYVAWIFVDLDSKNTITSTELLRRLVFLTLFGFYSAVIGYRRAKREYFGRGLQLDQLTEGEYDCNKYTEWIIALNPVKEAHPYLILVGDLFTIASIPLGADFSLLISTEKGRIDDYDKKGNKFSKAFVRRLFKARWKDSRVKGGLAETQWSVDIK